MHLLVKDLSFGYDANRTVLRGISFDAATGETVAVVGTSGCGKSTLLRVIAGLLPSRHSHFFNGDFHFRSIEASTTRTLEAGKLGFMFQQPALFPHRTILQNVQFVLDMSIRPKGLRHDIDALALLGSVGLAAAADRLPHELSLGMKTRVALVRTYASEPSVLLLDEPFASLDIGWKWALYRQFASRRAVLTTTTVLVTHDIEEALLLADKIVVLGSSGEIIGAATVPADEKPREITPAESADFLREMHPLRFTITELLQKDRGDNG